MIYLSAALVGAILGSVIAKRRKGKLADIVQYSVVFAIIFALVGMIATVVVHSLMV